MPFWIKRCFIKTKDILYQREVLDYSFIRETCKTTSNMIPFHYRLRSVNLSDWRDDAEEGS